MMKSRLPILIILTWCLLSTMVRGQVTTPQTASPSGSLTIEGSLAYPSGEVLVLTQQRLYLLDKHPGKILREAKVPLEKEQEGKGDDGYVEQLKARLTGQSAETRDQKAAQEIAQCYAALAAEAKATAVFDFNGKGQFVRLAPGQYYVFARVQPRDAFAVWLLPVTVKPGSNQLILNQSNALFVRVQ